MVGWTTNEPATSQVEYGLTVGYGSVTAADTNLVTNHSVSLTSLAAGATYHYRVKSKDAAGNLAISGDFTFKTQSPPDRQPPIVSNVTSNTYSKETQTINTSWTTNEPATSQVEYGEAAGLGQVTAEDSGLVISHTVKLTGISAEKIFYFKVRSRDVAGNLAISSLFSFNTRSAVQLVQDENLAAPVLEKLIFNNQEMMLDKAVLKVTKVDTFILVGKASPFAKVKIYVFSESRVYETSANGEGAWMVTISAADFEQGVHRVESGAETKEGKLTKREERMRFEVLAAEGKVPQPPQRSFPWIILVLLIPAALGAGFGIYSLRKRILAKKLGLTPPQPPRVV